MSTELTAWLENDANLPSTKDMGTALVDAGRANSNGSGVEFLSFNGKFGRWTIGKDKNEIDPEDLFVVEPSTFTEGWTFWLENKVPQGGTVEWLALKRRTAAVLETELDDPSNGARLGDGDGWKASAGFSCMTVEGRPYKFANNSKSGVGAVAALMDECGQRALAEEPELPILTLGQVTFQSHGQPNFKPVFKVESWVNRVTMTAYAKGDFKLSSLLKNEVKIKSKAARKK